MLLNEIFDRDELVSTYKPYHLLVLTVFTIEIKQKKEKLRLKECK